MSRLFDNLKTLAVILFVLLATVAATKGYPPTWWTVLSAFFCGYLAARLLWKDHA